MAIPPITQSSIPAPTAADSQPVSGTTAPVVAPSVPAPGTPLPVNVSAENVPAISTPSAVSSEGVPAVATPSILPGIAVPTINTPSTVAAQPAAAVNRALTPLFSFNAALGLPDSVTYSRSSSASYLEEYIGPRNRLQKRISDDYVGSVENLILYSENFDNSAWNNSNNTVVKKKSEGYLLRDENISATSLLQQNITITANADTHTVSAEVKSNDGDCNFAIVVVYNGGTLIADDVTFNLTSGIIVQVGTGIKDATMKYLGDGWYEVSVSYANNSSNNIFQTRIVPAFNFSTTINGVADSAALGSILIRKSQVTKSTRVLPYVRTFDVPVTQTFTASPRYEEKGLLVEGASTNLMIRSQDISDSGWFAAGITKAGNKALAPNDSFSAGKITEDSSNAAHLLLSPSFSAVSGRTYSFTVFVKKQSSRNITIGFQNTFGGSSASFFNLSTGVTNVASGAQVISAKQVEIANGWIRCEIQAIAEATSTSRGILYMTNESNVVSYQGDGQSTLLVWGCQVEELPFATSYIHTEGSTVTRAADVITSPIATINNELSISSKASSLGLQASAVAILDLATDANNFVRLSVSATGTDRFDIRNFGVLILGATGTSDLTGNNVRQTLTASRLIALGYSNGAVSVTDTSISVPAVTSVSIGRALQGGAIFYGNISNIEIYDLALTANEVKKL